MRLLFVKARTTQYHTLHLQILSKAFIKRVHNCRVALMSHPDSDEEWLEELLSCHKSAIEAWHVQSHVQ